MSITDDIKGEAKRVGFDLVGISPAIDLPVERSVMLSAIDHGFMGNMQWFDAERATRACRPSVGMPAATSVISLGASYPAESSVEGSSSEGPLGVISRYAWSVDYHAVLNERLSDLSDLVRRIAGQEVELRMFMDSGPLAERAFACRAGLGWFGKSANLLAPGLGSWFFLGEIVTSLDLEFDSRLDKSCGACDRCVRSCPTGAIVAPYVIDARRCISYLTIELKGAIAPELRPLIGNRIFGCDACQEVCPVNRKQGQISASGTSLKGRWFARHPDFDPQPGLLQILELSDEEYRSRYRASPVRRTKKRGLQRNAAVAIGNSGDAGLAPRLARSLGHSDELVRGHVAWALGSLGGAAARRALEAQRARESSEFICCELDSALAQLSVC